MPQDIIGPAKGAATGLSFPGRSPHRYPGIATMIFIDARIHPGKTKAATRERLTRYIYRTSGRTPYHLKTL
jgi:hypothetical protein